MMHLSITAKIAISSGLMLFILAVGRVLHNTGRPYLRGLFTAHIAATALLIAALVLFMFSPLKENDALISVILPVIFGLFFLALLVFSGLLLNLEKAPTPSLWLHRLATAGFITAAGLLVWKLAIL